MSSEKQIEFTKENIDLYLKEVAKEYRKQAGKKMPAELVLMRRSPRPRTSTATSSSRPTSARRRASPT